MQHITLTVKFQHDWRCTLGKWLIRLGARLANLQYVEDETLGNAPEPVCEDGVWNWDEQPEGVEWSDSTND